MNAHDDAALWNDWQTLGPPDRIPLDAPLHTQLFDRPLTLRRVADSVQVTFTETGEPVPHVALRHGWVWVCLGTPARDIVAFPRWDLPGRVFTHPGSFGVHASALRCVENFLDMGHFPFVHTDYLGKEPHTEVPPYKLHHEEATDQIVATDCKFWQPQGSPTAGSEGLDTQYEYRVVHPHIAMLKKPRQWIRVSSTSSCWDCSPCPRPAASATPCCVTWTRRARRSRSPDSSKSSSGRTGLSCSRTTPSGFL